MLSPTEQIALHDFYAFTKRLSDEQAIHHRRRVSAWQRSLPQRAGKALVRLAHFTPLLEHYAEAQKVRRQRKKGAETHVTILSEVHPEIDPERLARAFLYALEDYQRHEAEKGPRRRKR